MHCKHLASSVAALAMLALASASQPAQAHGHGGHGHGGYGHSGYGHSMSMGGGGWAPRYSSVQHFSHPHHHHFRFHHHRRFVVVGAYPYYYGDGCYWLRRRALYTGSPYWWHRYYACRNGDYY